MAPALGKEKCARERASSPTSLRYEDDALKLKMPEDVRLLSNLRRRSGQIHCDLEVASLAEEINFKALSYTWGPATSHDAKKLNEKEKREIHMETWEIMCNNQHLNVTKNLYDCLHELSELPVDHEAYSSRFWVDAVCINQGDSVERASQVSLMSGIYQKAQQVVIWLGPLEETTLLACELVGKLGRLSIKERDSLDLSSLGRDSSAESPLGSHHTSDHWRALIELFSRTWFSRSWVIQECVLAREIVVLCGARTINWSDIAETSDYLATRASKSALSSSISADIDLESSTYKTPAKLAAVKRDLIKKHPEALLRSLIRCRDYKCLKDEDKIYSVLGIHQAIEGPLSPGDRLYPDYQLSVHQVYRNAAVHILEHGYDLTLLTVAEGRDFRNIDDLPSWVPDWSYGANKTSLGLGVTGYERFNAAGSLERHVMLSKDNEILELRAAKLDDIVAVGETKETVDTGGPFHKWLDIIESLKPVSHTGEGRLEAFWRTLITNTGLDARFPADDRLVSGFRGWLAKKAENLDDNSRMTRRVRGLLQTSEEVGTNSEGLFKLVTEYDLQFGHALFQRLFSTSMGYLGLGSQSVNDRGEDSVWIVQGSRVPLILRKSGESVYQLVGGAYVHGFMQGEALHLGLAFERVDVE